MTLQLFRNNDFSFALFIVRGSNGPLVGEHEERDYGEHLDRDGRIILKLGAENGRQ